MGVLRVPPYDVNKWSIVDVAEAYNAYWLNDRIEWERSRFVGYLAAVPHLKRGTTPLKLHTFAWEKKSNFSREELEQLKKDIKKHKPHW